MSGLLPLYNQMLAYKKQSDNQDEDLLIDDLIDSYGLQRHQYYRFVLFPDIFPPCRPPMMFPYATHMYRDVGSVNRTATGGGLFIQWIPLVRSTGGQISRLITYTASDANTNIGDLSSAVTGEINTSHIAPAVTGVDADHVRGLAAFLTVTYIGRADELSGLIEVGIAVDDNVNLNATGRVASTSQLKSMYQYKKMDVSEGCRTVWLPLCDQDLEFFGNWPTVANNGSSLNMVYNIHITGAPTTANVFRIEFGYYYDGLVDETGYNILLPKKPTKNQYSTSQVVSQVRNNVEDFAVTKGIQQDQGFASQLWNNAKSKMEQAANNVSNLMLDRTVGYAVDSFDMFPQAKQGFWK